MWLQWFMSSIILIRLKLKYGRKVFIGIIWYMCDQCLSPLTRLWVGTPCSWRGVLDTTICDKVCQWLAAGRWFSPGTPVSSANKADRHDITEILLKVAWNTINQTKPNHTQSTIWSVDSILLNKHFTINFLPLYPPTLPHTHTQTIAIHFYIKIVSSEIMSLIYKTTT